VPRVKRLILISALAVLALPAAASSAPRAPRASASARTYIHCLNSAGTKYLRHRKPKKCAHFGPGGINAGGVNLTNINWKSWTGSQAKGSATELGFHMPYSHIHATIRAYRVRVVHGRHVYTRLRSHSKYGTTTVRLATYEHASY
jgi:hypothetical protein